MLLYIEFLCVLLIMISGVQFRGTGTYCMAAGLCPLALGYWRYYPCVKLSHIVSVTRNRPIFPVFAFKVMNRVILLTRFYELLTTVAILPGGHMPHVPQWHDAPVEERCKLPQRGPGQSPGRKHIFGTFCT